MSTVTTLLDFIRELLGNPAERAEFDLDPEAYLRDHGFGDLDGHDVYDAMGLVCDTLPTKIAQDVSVAYRTGGNKVDVHQSGPPPAHTQPHETDLEAAIRQINYVTNNYAYTQVDDRDNILDNSVHTNLYAKGDVDFDQDIHNENTIASGDGAVAAGHDIHGPVATGHDAIAAEDSNIAKDVSVDRGSALNIGSGEAHGHQDNSLDYDYNLDDHHTDNSIDADHSFNSDDHHIDADHSFNPEHHEVDADHSFNSDHHNIDADHSFNHDVEIEHTNDNDLIDLKDAVDVKDLLHLEHVDLDLLH